MFFLLVAAALTACRQTEPPPPAKPPPKPVQTSKPTEEQERALANALHRVHLDHEEPLKCADCHRIAGGASAAPLSERCVACHEQEVSAIHGVEADERVRDCLTCHLFLDEDADSWACTRCHERGAGLVRVPGELAGLDPLMAQKLGAHHSESCEGCHIPHEQPSPQPTACLSCHEAQTTQHASSKKSDPAQCLQCHRAHEPAAKAIESCTGCHATQTRSAARFPGHDECVTCHTPHGEKTEVKACTTCHTQQVLGSEHGKGHDRCTSCHAPHDVQASAPNRCLSCHAELTVKHPAKEQSGACTGCHAIHPVDGKLIDARTCSSCHTTASHDKAFHAQGLPCVSCHKPHEFTVSSASTDACRDCHGKSPHDKPRGSPHGAAGTPAATRIVPAPGHQDCRSCHAKAHAPSASLPDCRSCHAPQAQSLTKGHGACTSCHTPHEGNIKASCVSCHQGRNEGHHAKASSDCTSCHRAHGPEGPAQPKTCISCHTKPLPGLHAIEKHRECQQCHDFHSGRETPQPSARTTCIEPCHTPMRKHVPEAASCKGCHIFEGAP